MYAGWLCHRGRTHQAIANLGTQPTVSDSRPFLLEVHVPNIDLGDMYGETVEFCFDYRVRDVQRFDSLTALKSQIEIDTNRATKRLTGRRPKRISVS